MLFNSLRFVIFFIPTYLIYLALKQKWQNRLLLAASYVFYSFWDWRFLSLIVLSTVLNYYFGLKIDSEQDERRRKLFIIISVFLNLAILGFFKYFDFFADNLQALLWVFGWHTTRVSVNIVLPLGISFYTFLIMTYTIDIYRRVMKPTRNFLDFALFVSFFPQLIAGPIERARNLIPQIQSKRIITRERFYEGSWLIFWGLYKKIVVADNLSKITGQLFQGVSPYFGGETVIATYAFAFQVYADFSGYSDMARGLARLMGFDLMANFRVPFFSRNVYDLWQRWHISLTTWIKEYVFYPLALAKFYGRQLAAPLVIMLTWALMGFWHGPAWRYIVWGLYHALLIIIYSRIKPYLGGIRIKNRIAAAVVGCAQIFLVFNLFCVGIIFFASRNMIQVSYSVRQILFHFSDQFRYKLNALALLGILMIPFFLVEYRQFKTDDEMAIFKWPLIVRSLMYYLILYLIICYGDLGAQKYYYFQF